MDWSILDYDLFENSTGQQSSRHNTQASWDVGFLGSHSGVALTNYDGTGNSDVYSLDGYEMHWGIQTSNATSGVYTIKFSVSDSADSPATDSGPVINYVTVTVNP